MAILVIAEHDNEQLKHHTLNTVAAAAQCGQGIDVLVLGHKADSVVDQVSSIAGINKVLYASAPHYTYGLAENLAPVVLGLAQQYSHILAPASTFGKNLLPRVAALLDVAPLSDVTAILSPDTFVRPIYAGNILATVQSTDAIKVITVRTTAFDAAAWAADSKAVVQKIDALPVSEVATFIEHTTTAAERPDLGAAAIVVAGGRALGSQEQFNTLVVSLADCLGGAVGASRAAVDAGYAPNEYQVGQTGRVVAPQLYIAIGISGAIQHLAGMKESKVIVAINKDPDAPIFQVADYGLVGDLFTVVPELIAALTQ